MFNQQTLKKNHCFLLQQMLKQLDSSYMEIRVIDSIAPNPTSIIKIEQSSPEGKLMIDILRKKWQKELDQLKKEIDQ